MNQIEKAAFFKSLHKKGDPLVLYNIWDAGGAKALAETGAAAVATGSWSVAAAHGFDDGEAIPLDFLLQIVARISASVELPVSVDFEGGYAVGPEEVAQNVLRVIRAGAVGINFEDRIVQGEGLYLPAAQAARISTIRAAADREEMPLFINARTDLFLGTDPASHAARLPEALERAAEYAAAGADGFFVPVLSDPALVARLAEGTSLPLNVMMAGDQPQLEDLRAAGISRASFGPVPYIRAMQDLKNRAQTL